MNRKNGKFKAINENEDGFATVISVRSLSDGKKDYNNCGKNKINENNNSNNINNIKIENKESEPYNIIEIKNEDNSDNEENENNNNYNDNFYDFYSAPKDVINFINYDNSLSSSKKNIEINNNSDDINIINNNSIKELDYDIIFGLENSLSYSFPIDYEDKIQLIDDPSYFLKNSRYIKYNPIDYYLPPVPPDKKKPFNAKISKTLKVDFRRKENMLIDSDNDITDITSFDIDNNNELPAILSIPRIKPCKDEHAQMIKDKLKQDGIQIFQTENEKMKSEEQSIYLGSFLLYDEKSNIKVYVPCYKDNIRNKDFIKKKKLEIIEFQEDNDIDTDEEQLQLEIERNNEALLSFMEKVEKDKDYVDNNLHRKKKK